jgi:heme/copper-type cytochrome/quinol oxidase subunit 2
MVGALLTAYAVVAIIAAIIVFIASARLGDERRPALERIALSLAAGFVWPVILLGLAEVSSFAMYAKVHEHDDDTARVEVLV